MKKTIGLCGAHRVGKTTLAQNAAFKLGVPYVAVNTGAVFAKHNITPNTALDFKTRLKIQHEVLNAAMAVWCAQNDGFITDRTPIDFIAYTLADIQGASDVDYQALSAYMDSCFSALAHVFDCVVLVQPGIPLVYEVGKAALNEAYIAHLNVLMRGLCGDDRLAAGGVVARVLPQSVLDLTARCDFLNTC